MAKKLNGGANPASAANPTQAIDWQRVKDLVAKAESLAVTALKNGPQIAAAIQLLLALTLGEHPAMQAKAIRCGPGDDCCKDCRECLDCAAAQAVHLLASILQAQQCLQTTPTPPPAP
jgi:hypothetical protein